MDPELRRKIILIGRNTKVTSVWQRMLAVTVQQRRRQQSEWVEEEDVHYEIKSPTLKWLHNHCKTTGEPKTEEEIKEWAEKLANDVCEADD